MSKQIKQDITPAARFRRTFWFIDDLRALNDGGQFHKSFKEKGYRGP